MLDYRRVPSPKLTNRPGKTDGTGRLYKEAASSRVKPIFHPKKMVNWLPGGTIFPFEGSGIEYPFRNPEIYLIYQPEYDQNDTTILLIWILKSSIILTKGWPPRKQKNPLFKNKNDASEIAPENRHVGYLFWGVGVIFITNFPRDPRHRDDRGDGRQAT